VRCVWEDAAEAVWVSVRGAVAALGRPPWRGRRGRLDQHSRSRLRQLPGRVVRSVLGVGSLPDRYRFRPRLTTRFTLPLFARTAPNPGFSEVTRPLLAPLE
jgi:hypothetical protein